MRVLHISTGDNRGAYSGAYRLHRNMVDSGHNSLMLVGSKTVDDPTVLAPAPFYQGLRARLERAGSIAARLAFGREAQARHIFKPNWGLVPTRQVLRQIRDFQPDLVIVYYVADFLSERQLQRIREVTQAPMAFYLMDMGMLTAGCHYAWDCPGYHSNCAVCPATDSSVLRHLLARKWRSRAVAYAQIQPVVVSASGQLQEQVALSGLVRHCATRKILIGIQPELYHPRHREAARQELGLVPDALVVYFGAQHVDDVRKGFAHLVAALRQLAGLLTPEVQSRICLLTIGSGDPLGQHGLPFRHVHIPFITQPEKFARTYGAADVFICPSVQDSGPMMINESVMSGTPVIAFDAGVAKDLVFDGETGYKVPLADEQALAAALARFVSLPDAQREQMRGICRAKAMQLTSTQQQMQSFVDLAQQLRSRSA